MNYKYYIIAANVFANLFDNVFTNLCGSFVRLRALLSG